MTQQAASRDQTEAQITQRAATDQQFRQALLNNPKQALEQEMGIQLPDSISIQVLEETPASFILVLPSTAPQLGQELSHSDLDAVAGGWSGAGEGGTECGSCGKSFCCGW